jgi:hypothetical protein
VPRLYIVIKDGGPWPRNTYVEEDPETGMLQAVRVRQEGSRIRPTGYMGFVIPMSSARPYIIRIQKGGLDDYARRYEVS